jgi:hypothetical protein
MFFSIRAMPKSALFQVVHANSETMYYGMINYTSSQLVPRLCSDPRCCRTSVIKDQVKLMGLTNFLVPLPSRRVDGLQLLQKIHTIICQIV